MEDVPYARILREGWLLVLIVALLGAGGAYGIAKLLPETYASTSTLMLQVDSKEASLFERNQFSLARIRSYPELVDSPEVIAGIRSDLHLSAADYSDRDLRKMVSADNTTDTVLLVVRAEAPTAQLSAAVANAAAAHLSKLIQSTENSDADERYQVNLTVVLPAVEPLAPVSPQTLAIVGLGLIVGLAVGGIVAVYRTVTNRNVITISDVRRLVGIRVVGRIPRRRRWRRSDDEDESVAFDETVANLGVLGGSDLSSVLVLTASDDAIGQAERSGLAAAFAAAGRTVTILETRATSDAAAETRSLAEVLDGEDVDAAVGEAAGRQFADPLPVAAAALQDALPALRSTLRAHVDVVVVVVDAASVAVVRELVDDATGVVVAVRSGSTAASALSALITKLSFVDVHPLGVVLTGTARHASGVVTETWRDAVPVGAAGTGAAARP
ncbi:YveK family protein [Microbacterium laevaniformans]|uniref:YveK family protein n=1 Tax=Microbacterium laevaniformans TaxID=36807 RepID=UPI003630DF6C